MQNFYLISNYIGVILSPIFLSSLIFVWLCVYFKKKTLLTKIYGNVGTVKRSAYIFYHHTSSITIALLYIICLAAQIKTPNNFLRPDVVAIYFFSFLIFAVFTIDKIINFFINFHNKIEPS